VSSILPFPFVFAFKETSGCPEVHEDKEVKNEVTTWLHALALVFYDIRIQKLIPTLNMCLNKGGDCVEK
jgi:hypothetical protein